MDIDIRSSPSAPTESAGIGLDLSSRGSGDAAEGIIRAQEREYARIASDIHDGPIQSLNALQMRLAHLARRSEDPELLADIKDSEDHVSRCVGELRRLSFELHPPQMAAEEGFRSTIEKLLDHTSKEIGARTIQCNILSIPADELVRVVIYRATLEALTNIRANARARSLWLSLEEHRGGYLLQVSDDGRGFAPDQGAGNHVGLINLRERAEVAGGWCRVESGPGRTTVEVWVPGRISADAPLASERSAGPPDAVPWGDEGGVDRLLTSRGLSPREIEVARLLVLGYTNGEIAANLYLSVRTIEHHRAKVFRKLRVHSRATLVHQIRANALFPKRTHPAQTRERVRADPPSYEETP